MRRRTRRHRFFGLTNLTATSAFTNLRNEVQVLQLALQRSEAQYEIYSGTFNDRVRRMIEHNEDEAPWIPLTERNPAASSHLLLTPWSITWSCKS